VDRIRLGVDRIRLGSLVLALCAEQVGGADYSVEDPISLVGNTGTTMPQCQAYEGGVCANGGFKLLVADATQPNLIAHYNFDDARSTDTSGKGNHAETAPLAGPGHGPTGSGAWFDGTGGMTIPHIPAMNSPDLTVCFWMYLLDDSTNSYRTLLRKAKDVSDMTPALMLLPNERRLHVRLTTTSSGVIGFDSTAIIPLKRWTHVAYVLKGGAALSLYVNGIKDCPHARGLRRGECPPGGATYAWDEGDVLHNEGPLHVGADPFMSGTRMFFDTLKIFNKALPEAEVVVEASDALGTAGTAFLRLGCTNCTLSELQASCTEADGYHPCLCQELMAGGLHIAKSMGWLRGASDSWAFHADVRNPNTCTIVPENPPPSQAGFCCKDFN